MTSSKSRLVTSPYKGGELVLVRRAKLGSRLIGWGQRRKFPQEYAYWTHCGIMVDSINLAEARARGVVINQLSEYDDIPHAVVTITTNEAQRLNVIHFATHLANIEEPYGYAEIATQGVYLATGARVRLALNNQLICSAMAAEACCRTEAIFPEEPLWCVPAHLAQYYDVRGPMVIGADGA